LSYAVIRSKVSKGIMDFKPSTVFLLGPKAQDSFEAWMMTAKVDWEMLVVSLPANSKVLGIERVTQA
jgi:hypothetical protein